MSEDLKDKVEVLSELLGELQVQVAQTMISVTEALRDSNITSAEIIKTLAAITDNYMQQQKTLNLLASSLNNVVERVELLEESNKLLYKKNIRDSN